MGIFPFFKWVREVKSPMLLLWVETQCLLFWPWSYCFEWKELIDPSPPITCHIHLWLNQVWKDLIPVKLLKDQMCFKLIVERQNVVQAHEKLFLMLDSGAILNIRNIFESVFSGFWTRKKKKKQQQQIFKQKRNIWKVLLNDALRSLGLFHSTAAFLTGEKNLKLFFPH